MGDYSHIEIRQGWAELVIDRPDRRNSLIPPLFAEITESLKELGRRDDVAAIILRGDGGYFCSGIDLKALQEEPPEWASLEHANARAMHLALYGCEKPIIAAMERFAINAGASLALACDLIVGGKTAFFQIGEIQQGVSIPMNAAWLSIKTTETVAARLAYIGDRVLSDELVRLGIITESIEDDKVLDRCREIAERLAAFPEGATQKIKAALVAQRGISDPEAFFPDTANSGLKGAGLLNG